MQNFFILIHKTVVWVNDRNRNFRRVVKIYPTTNNSPFWNISLTQNPRDDTACAFDC